MADLFLLSEAQMRRIEPYFPLSHGIARVDDRRVISGIPLRTQNHSSISCRCRRQIFRLGRQEKSTENIDEWYRTRKSLVPASEWLDDLARWNLERRGAPFKERVSYLRLQDAAPSEGFALDYDTLVLANKFHPNGWGD
jgi:hypothetical protein